MENDSPSAKDLPMPKTINNNVEYYLRYLVENGGGGGGGTTNYEQLSNKPQINGTTLSGNKSLSDLGAQASLVSGTNIKTINNQSLLGSGNIDIQGGGSDLPIAFSSTRPATDGSVLLWVNAEYTPVSPTGVTVSPATLSGVVGSTGSLTATITPSGATGTIVWASSNTAVATVSNGTVTYVSAGNATITATIDGTSISGTCAVTVSAVPVEPTGITVSPSTLVGTAGQTGNLTATLTPSGATGTILWSSSDTSIATVSNGVVSYIAEGNATITATIDGKQLSDTCAVTVNAAPVVDTITGYAINGAPTNINIVDQTATNPGQYQLTYNGTNYPYNEVGIKNGGNYVTKVRTSISGLNSRLLNVAIDESATEGTDLISLCLFTAGAQNLGFRLNKSGIQTGQVSINPTKEGTLTGFGEYIIHTKTEGTSIVVTFTNPTTNEVEQTLTWANLGSTYTPAIGFGYNQTGNQSFTFKIV